MISAISSSFSTAGVFRLRLEPMTFRSVLQGVASAMPSGRGSNGCALDEGDLDARQLEASKMTGAGILPLLWKNRCAWGEKRFSKRPHGECGGGASEWGEDWGRSADRMMVRHQGKKKGLTIPLRRLSRGRCRRVSRAVRSRAASICRRVHHFAS